MNGDEDLYFRLSLAMLIVKSLNDMIDKRNDEIKSLKETIKDLKAELEDKDNIISDLQSNLDHYIEIMED